MNQGVYISSLEANDIYCHMVRGTKIKPNYTGKIPFSLELIKLNKLKKEFSTFQVKTSDKKFSDDIINVKFKQKVRSAEEIIQILSKKVKDLDIEITKLNGESEKEKVEKRQSLTDDKNNLDERIKEFKLVKETEKWKGLSNEELREHLYLNGFTIINEKGKQTKYVVYKRSSSKSRTGQCLFIKESLHDKMIKWSRMNLDFKPDMSIDYASLLAYESLVLSSLENTIKINPKHILIVDDVESKFNQACNVVRKNKNTNYLDSFTENITVTNSLFDGESLLDSKYFADGQAMKLLRNHMFKSAAFNCNIQQFLRNHCPEGIVYNEWEIDSMFEGEKILAKDIELIITPSSLKALKFSHVTGGKKQMWNYWQEFVDKEDWIFGVCKHEKKSKRGEKDGKPLQQMSYQMINSMPMSPEDIDKLVSYERDYYIDKLKNDDGFFIQYISDNANEINSNLMFADLYKRNKDIINTKVFRDFRKSEINKYVTHVRKGKARLIGDYCVMLGNPMELLYHVIDQFNVETSELALKGNEIYTKLFDFDKELVGFRNPHTSPSNVLKVKNTYNHKIDTYFNLSDNIVCVNAVNFAIQDILSGCDYDSDTVLIFDSEILSNLADQCFGKYPVCINKVESQKKTYKLNKNDMSKIDNQLSLSQKFIGRVVNLGQLCMSLYWDKLTKNETKELKKLMKKVDVMTVLSGIAIDMAKKFYEIDIKQEIKNVEDSIKDDINRINVYDSEGNKVLNTNGQERKISAKPLFFKYISQSKTIKNRIDQYNCPMDYLYQAMELPYAEHHENVKFISLLIKHNKRKGDRKQEGKILDYVEEMNEKIKNIYAKYDNFEERNNAIEHVIKYYDYYMEKLTVKPDTMYDIMLKMIKNKNKVVVQLMNVLYRTQKEVFMAAFKK